jgi:pseudaminic acid biosynthesis-associated methylase
MRQKTDQERFWSSDFGDEYSKRNVGLVETNIAFFARALQRTHGIKRVIELGCGTGQNLSAIKRLMPKVETMGVEINESAALEIPTGYVFVSSIFDFQPPVETPIDLAFVKGVGIHIAEEHIKGLYDKLYECSSRYILMAEYFSPRRQAIEYRGHKDRMWKANFYQEMIDVHPDLVLLDYGFVGSWDVFPQDNLNWWLWTKRI